MKTHALILLCFYSGVLVAQPAPHRSGSAASGARPPSASDLTPARPQTAAEIGARYRRLEADLASRYEAQIRSVEKKIQAHLDAIRQVEQQQTALGAEADAIRQRTDLGRAQRDELLLDLTIRGTRLAAEIEKLRDQINDCRATIRQLREELATQLEALRRERDKACARRITRRRAGSSPADRTRRPNPDGHPSGSSAFYLAPAKRDSGSRRDPN